MSSPSPTPTATPPIMPQEPPTTVAVATAAVKSTPTSASVSAAAAAGTATSAAAAAAVAAATPSAGTVVAALAPATPTAATVVSSSPTTLSMKQSPSPMQHYYGSPAPSSQQVGTGGSGPRSYQFHHPQSRESRRTFVASEDGKSYFLPKCVHFRPESSKHARSSLHLQLSAGVYMCNGQRCSEKGGNVDFKATPLVTKSQVLVLRYDTMMRYKWTVNVHSATVVVLDYYSVVFVLCCIILLL